MMIEKTLVLIKPDAIQRGLSGQILSRYEAKGLKIIGLKMVHLKEAMLKEHYAHVADKPFFKELAGFMSSSPLLALCLEGNDAVNMVRKLSGTDNFDFGTIRGDLSISSQRNLVHSSDSLETAKNEIDRFFEPNEIFDYQKDEWKHIYAENDKK